MNFQSKFHCPSSSVVDSLYVEVVVQPPLITAIDTIECVIHVSESAETSADIVEFSAKSYASVKSCLQKWILTIGLEREVCIQNYNTLLQPLFQIQSKYSYHKKSDSKFANNTVIRRAEKRFAKELEQLTEVSDVEDSYQRDSQPKRKRSQKLRYAVAPMSQSQRSAHILPVQCIICLKKECRIKKAGQ